MKSIQAKLLGGLVVIFLILQLFEPDRAVPEYPIAKDFIQVTKPPAQVADLLQSTCYDCHSYKTTYPWYANIEPVSWWLQDHINEGREELNFSLWKDYTVKRADHKLEEAIEKVEEGDMPLPSYTWVHSDARLSDEQRTILTDWFSSLR